MASKTDSTKVMWRVQTKAKTGRWINRGLYETRDVARIECMALRHGMGKYIGQAWGYGRTRIVRHVRGGGR